MKIATFAISASVESRRVWVLLAPNSWNCSQVIPDALAYSSKLSLILPVSGLLVESVDLRSFGGSAGGDDVLGDNFDGCQVAPGEKEVGPLRRKGACDSAADRASGSVDHSVQRRGCHSGERSHLAAGRAWKRQRVWLNISPRPAGGPTLPARLPKPKTFDGVTSKKRTSPIGRRQPSPYFATYVSTTRRSFASSVTDMAWPPTTISSPLLRSLQPVVMETCLFFAKFFASRSPSPVTK